MPTDPETHCEVDSFTSLLVQPKQQAIYMPLGLFKGLSGASEKKVGISTDHMIPQCIRAYNAHTTQQ